MAWNIHVSCYLSCATCDYSTHDYPHVTIHAIAMNGTRVGTNMQLTFVILQQVTYKNMSNLLHNSENYTRNALINSLINYQGNSACNKNILIMALTIVVSCCSVPQLYEYKQSGNKVRST